MDVPNYYPCPRPHLPAFCNLLEVVPGDTYSRSPPLLACTYPAEVLDNNCQHTKSFAWAMR